MRRDDATVDVLPGSWRSARLRASETPDSRDRYVDFLRAASIVVVVLGHWIMAAPTVESGVGFTLSDILRVAPLIQWLTWVFQVMPLFFFVGGYSNAASWESARRKGMRYDAWLSRRLQRLVRPVIPFLLVWCGLGLSARWLRLGRGVVESGSEAAFVPTWFLAVYVLVVALAPAMHWWWRRHGVVSFWALVVGAAVVDWIARGGGIGEAQWVNHVFVWLAMHQLGFAWRDGILAKPARALFMAAGGAVALVALQALSSYPVSMVTVPDSTPSNGNPPTLLLLALGVTHTGLVLAVGGQARRLLAGEAFWTTVVLVNEVIMTVYLWHATAMVLLVGLAEVVGGVGLHFLPNTSAWWLARIPWIMILLIVLAGFVGVFGRAEIERAPRTTGPPAWQSAAGALALCVGLVALAARGIWGDNPLGMSLWPVLLSLAGILLVTGSRVDSRSSSA